MFNTFINFTNNSKCLWLLETLKPSLVFIGLLTAYFVYYRRNYGKVSLTIFVLKTVIKFQNKVIELKTSNVVSMLHK